MHEVHQFAVLQVRVQLDLVGGDGVFADHLDGLAQQVDGEVGHADLPGQALFLSFGQGAHEFADGHCALGRWPVDQGQVQVVAAQLAQAVLEAGDQLVGGQVVRPDLAGDKQLVTVDAAGGHGLADFGFVTVDLRGVDGAVTEFQGGGHRIDHHLVLEAEGAEAEGGNSH
ncbi:hypothetical protein D9M71_574100 [compost metagenome]